MRPLKRWRYVGAYGPEVMACVGDVRIGFLRQRFWAVCEPGRPIVERTTLGRGGVAMDGSRARGDARGGRIRLTVEEDGGGEGGGGWVSPPARGVGALAGLPTPTRCGRASRRACRCVDRSPSRVARTRSTASAPSTRRRGAIGGTRRGAGRRAAGAPSTARGSAGTS